MINKRLTYFVGLVDRDGKLLQDQTVIDVTAKAFTEQGWPGFTVTRHVGYWNGVAEASLSFLVLFDSETKPGFLPQLLAADLARLFNQEAVLYTLETVWAELVEPSSHIEIEGVA